MSTSVTVANLPLTLLGGIEPHADLLPQPNPSQRLFKIMQVEHLIQSIASSYLHFNRVNAYAGFPSADANDGVELPMDKPANQAASFEKAPDYTLSDYYAQSRARTYACCFFLENSEYIWKNYALGSEMGQIGIEFDLDKLRHHLNGTLSGPAALLYNGVSCHQIFAINYGEVTYVDSTTYRRNETRSANPIEYAYLKDRIYSNERELRVSLSAPGMGRFLLSDGNEIEFPPHLQLSFDYRQAIADGTIVQFLASGSTDWTALSEALEQLGIRTIMRDELRSGPDVG